MRIELNLRRRRRHLQNSHFVTVVVVVRILLFYFLFLSSVFVIFHFSFLFVLPQNHCSSNCQLFDVNVMRARCVRLWFIYFFRQFYSFIGSDLMFEHECWHTFAWFACLHLYFTICFRLLIDKIRRFLFSRWCETCDCCQLLRILSVMNPLP